MIFHFSPPDPRRATLLALHGRGGGERQLLALCRAADRSLGILAPRGEVSSPPGYAWSHRHAVGMPCVRDLRRRATALGCWLDRALAGLGVAPPLVVVGYSNGAIMGVALAALRPDLVGALALLRGSYPLPGLLGGGVLRGTAVLASEGEVDQLLSAGTSAAAARLLRSAGARVETVRHPGAGHGLCLSDGRELRRWLMQSASTGRPSSRSGGVWPDDVVAVFRRLTLSTLPRCSTVRAAERGRPTRSGSASGESRP